MIDMDEYAPTAALGAIALIAIPLVVVTLPLWLLGRAIIKLWERSA